MSKADVAKVFEALEATHEGKRITRRDIAEYLGVEELPRSIDMPLMRMKKSGEVIATKESHVITVDADADIFGRQVNGYKKKQRMDAMYLNKNARVK